MDEVERLPDAAAPGGLCIDMRCEFRASLTFGERAGASIGESLAAALDGLDIRTPPLSAPESVSLGEATKRLFALLSSYPATDAAVDEDLPRLAQAMIARVADRSSAETVTCASFENEAGKGLVIIGLDYSWAAWMHADLSLPLRSRRPSTR